MRALALAAASAALSCGGCRGEPGPPGGAPGSESAEAAALSGHGPENDAARATQAGRAARAARARTPPCAGSLPEGGVRARLDTLVARCAPGTSIAAASLITVSLRAGDRASATLTLEDASRCLRGVAAAAPGVRDLVLRVTPARGAPATSRGAREALAGADGPLCPGAGRHTLEVEVVEGEGEVIAALTVVE